MKPHVVLIATLILVSMSVQRILAKGDTETFRPERTDISPADRQRVATVVRPTVEFSSPESFEIMQGGASTSSKLVNRDAFSQFSANLSFDGEEPFKLGNALFRKLWVPSPSSTLASDGLGPLFNARSCQSCHIKDGRGRPPDSAGSALSMLLRLAREPENIAEMKAIEDGLVLSYPDPVYGGQFQDNAVTGILAEGKVTVTWESAEFRFADGESVSLRKPTYDVSKLGYGPLAEGTTISARIAPPMIGLGLIEAIHPSDIYRLADPDDVDHDGISGKLSIVRDETSAEPALGLFGWKASAASIEMQTANAFNGDIGISSDLNKSHTGDCTSAQTACLALPNGVQNSLGDSEAPPPVLDLVAFYSRNLAVPARRDADNEDVLRGKQLFYDTGCTSCHWPKFVTRRDAIDEVQSFQLIWPYSDFLLHDMGEGLADGQSVGVATGREWRTPPLWGIGLTETVSGHTFFLHDGRARNLNEAIIWHGGEAEVARDAYARAGKADRVALIKFLESL